MMDAFSPEKNIIGCILLGDNEGEIFGEVDPADFQDEQWQLIYLRLKSTWEKVGKVSAGEIGSFSGPQKEMLLFAADTLPSISSWRRYVQQMKDDVAVFKAQAIGMQLATNGMDIDDIRMKANELIQAVNETSEAESLSMADGVANFLKEKGKPRQYIKTGYSRLDKYTYLDKGDYVVIGGRPSAGKTAFSLVLALKMAGDGRRIAYFSLETSPQKIMDRIITTFCGLDFGKVKRQELDDEWDMVEHLNEDLMQFPIDIIPASGRTVAWIQAESLRRKADIAIIDYIGLIKAEGNGRYEKMTNISMDIHNFCQRTGVLVIGLSQLNRGGTDKPTMEHIRESGQIEQDADVIMLLHNEQVVDEYGEYGGGEYTVIIAKNKEGMTGDIPFRFEGRTQRFYPIEVQR